MHLHSKTTCSIGTCRLVDNAEKGHVYYPIKALLTNDLFDPCFNDEICEEKITDLLKVAQRQMSSLKSPSAKRVVPVSIPVNFFSVTLKNMRETRTKLWVLSPCRVNIKISNIPAVWVGYN